ncbi:MAG: carboxymuconolactone decarboxylase family protein [Bacteriovoracia bacterium]
MQRLNYYPHFLKAFQKMTEIETLIKESSFDHHLVHLVKLRASQINGCALCVDTHSKEAKIDGERELRLYHVAVWEESPLFSEKEKAALLWTEHVTKLSQAPISDELFAKVKAQFSDKELTELTMVIAMINAWNRFGAPFRTTPGSMDKMLGLDKAGL